MQAANVGGRKQPVVVVRPYLPFEEERLQQATPKVPDVNRLKGIGARQPSRPLSAMLLEQRLDRLGEVTACQRMVGEAVGRALKPDEAGAVGMFVLLQPVGESEPVGLLQRLLGDGPEEAFA